MQTKFVKIVFIFCALVFTTAHAQTAIVSGKVIDEGNNVVQDVAVAINGTSIQAVFTGSDGTYQITIPADKEVEIVFINLSYAEFRQKITAKPNEKINISPKLIFKNKLVDSGYNMDGKLRKIRFHAISADNALEEFDVSSKSNTSRSFIELLRSRGREAATQWLADNKDTVGNKTIANFSVNLQHEFIG